MKKFYEYSAFKDDPVIGERSIQNIEEALFLTVAHEIAHFVQYEIAPRVPRFHNLQKITWRWFQSYLSLSAKRPCER